MLAVQQNVICTEKLNMFGQLQLYRSCKWSTYACLKELLIILCNLLKLNPYMANRNQEYLDSSYWSMNIDYMDQLDINNLCNQNSRLTTVRQIRSLRIYSQLMRLTEIANFSRPTLVARSRITKSANTCTVRCIGR